MFEGFHEGEREDAQFTLSEGEMELIEELSRNPKISIFVMPVGVGENVLKAAEILETNPADFANNGLSTVAKAIIKGGRCLVHLHAILNILTKDEED